MTGATEASLKAIAIFDREEKPPGRGRGDPGGFATSAIFQITRTALAPGGTAQARVSSCTAPFTQTCLIDFIRDHGRRAVRALAMRATASLG